MTRCKMWLLALLCGLGTQPDNPEPELSAAWKAVPLIIVYDDGTQRKTNVFDFARSQGEQGEALERAFSEASREVPEEDMELFFQRLLMPAVGLRPDGTFELTPRARWYLHPDQPDLFRLQVEDLRLFVKGHAFWFDLWPVLTPDQHQRVVGQIDRLFAEVEAQARRDEFDMDQVKSRLAVERLYADQFIHPPDVGCALQPLTDEEMDEQLRQIRTAFETRRAPEEDDAFLKDLLLETIDSFRLPPITIDDPELQEAHEKLRDETSRVFIRRYEWEWRVASTRPALIPSVTIHRAADRPSSQPAMTQPASSPAAQSELAPESWEAIELTYVTGTGRRVRTNLPEFRASHGKKGRALFDAVTAAAHPIPPERLPLFIEGLALPGVVVMNLPSAGNRLPLPGVPVNPSRAELRRVPRAQWEVHPTDDPLFDAEVKYLEAYVAAQAAAFLASPSLDDEQRAKVAGQLDLVLDELKQQCTSYGFDPERSDAAIQLPRSVAEECTHPARSGVISEPLTDSELATVVDRIQQAFKKTRVSPAEEEAFVQRVGVEAVGAFMRPVLISPPDSPQGKLRRALDEAREHKLRLEDARAATRPVPAATSRPSQEPASSTSPTAPTPASRQAATRPASP